MNIIIPMAGWGSRLRPHTLTVPKPLVKIAGKSIVQRLVENLSKSVNEPIDEIAFIIREDFGKEIEQNLIDIANNLGTKGLICYQSEPLGTAHAIMCAKHSLKGNIIVAFADTLFKTDFTLDTTADGVIWVSKIDDPSAFGVIKLNEQNIITDFVEKPKEFVSDLAIIGIYYFKDGAYLRNELAYLLDNDIKEKGEYQLTSALENMKQKGSKFIPGRVDEWLDCGNKNATVHTNTRILEHIKLEEKLIDTSVSIENSIIIEPCYIGKGSKITNSIIGPYVSVESNTTISNSQITHSIIQSKSTIDKQIMTNSMIGSNASIMGKSNDFSIGDYNQLII
ncbi:MAG: sugar phosphate nucleotidyltransferase [Bacteroidota bacterium]